MKNYFCRFFLCCLFLINSQVTAKEYQDQYFVLIILDGCRADYFELSQMPVIEGLKKQGVSYTNAWVGHMINNTPTSHAVIQTGLFPKNNGIIGFYWKVTSPSGKEIIVKPSKWKYVVKGTQIKILNHNNAKGFIGVLKSVYGDFFAAAVSGHKFYAAEAVGGPFCDVIAFPTWGIEKRLTEKQRQYGLWKSFLNKKEDHFAKIASVKGKAPSEMVLNDKALKEITVDYGDDETALALSLSIIRHQKPKIMIINFPRLDTLGHKDAGGYQKWRSVIGAYMNHIDGIIGSIINEYKNNGIFDKTIFIVTSDHGMITNGKQISPRDISKAGGIKGEIGNFIWFLNQKESVIYKKAVNLAKMEIPFIRAIYIKKQKEGKFFYELAPGYSNKLDLELQKTYDYLLNTHLNSGSADLHIFTYEHTLITDKSKPDIVGNHASVTWKNQHIPLVMSGPGIKKDYISDYPARLVDIAPTILTLFGIRDATMDGIVLADALTEIQPDLIKIQNDHGEIFRPMIEALRSISLKDMSLIYSTSSSPDKIP